ncbi:hypothetical protein GE09DRAFT_1226255 [Coniochaeta sp. 2T2.1]|nr:hypothetical protein GE09DRAFT_1226255 [Coniochaeta sp. 2T2.1]
MLAVKPFLALALALCAGKALASTLPLVERQGSSYEDGYCAVLGNECRNDSGFIGTCDTGDCTKDFNPCRSTYIATPGGVGSGTTVRCE